MIFRQLIEREALGSVGASLFVAALALLACGNGNGESDDGTSGPPECLEEPANAACDAALYGLDPMTGEIAPTFEDVFTTTLQKKCAATTACHSGSNAPNGLAMDDIDAAHAALLADGSRGIPRVIPGDVQCGELIVRLEHGDTTYGMPPGQPLSEAELCSIRHWIAGGALR